jgi:hypothetical protein
VYGPFGYRGRAAAVQAAGGAGNLPDAPGVATPPRMGTHRTGLKRAHGH